MFDAFIFLGLKPNLRKLQRIISLEMSDCMRISFSPIKIFGLLVVLSAFSAIGLFGIGYLLLGSELALQCAKTSILFMVIVGGGGPLF